jgi:hypothetical protein
VLFTLRCRGHQQQQRKFGRQMKGSVAGAMLMLLRLWLLSPTRPARCLTSPFSLSSRRGISSERQQRSKLTSKIGDAPKDTTATSTFEESLAEVESEALYGLGTVQSTLSTFVNMLQIGSLNLFPRYQRSYVWQPDKSSRLIVTALCNRFVPPVVLHEVSKGVFDVVDGKQRLTSLLGFYLNSKEAQLPRRPNMDKLQSFLPQLASLSKLDESYESLNGLSYDALSEERQLAYQSYKVSFMVIPLNTPKTDVFEVYEDINSGGEDLTAQQVRRAVYHGPYMNLIDDLKESCSDFHAVRLPAAYKAGTYMSCKKDSDGELILRAFAFRRKGDRFKTPIKSFLNRELDGSADADCTTDEDKRRVLENVDQQRQEFAAVMKIAREIFGDNAFRKKEKKSFASSSTIVPISTSMWDAQYCAIAELMAQYSLLDFTKSKDRIAAALQDNLQNGFFATDDNKTTASKFVQRKHKLKTLICNAIDGSNNNSNRQRGGGGGGDERSLPGGAAAATATPTTTMQDQRRRSFPPAWRRHLFVNQKGMCALCRQSLDWSRVLDETDYAHLDHIHPYSKGGKTVFSNAQLVHAICNRSKGNKLEEEEKAVVMDQTWVTLLQGKNNIA